MPTKKGGKLKANELKDFLNASYDKTPPNDLDGYILDKSLSTDTAKVYYNPQTNHAVVAHRGTKGALDWGNNLAYALGAYEYTPRYKQGKSVQDKAEKKYGKQNISTLGHSQGAILARKLGSDTKEVINVNPAYTFEKPKKNEYNVRSSTDIVSGLYAPVAKTREVLFPNYSKKHDITIPSQSATDILGEHSYNILDRLGEKEIGVGAGNKFSYNNIMKCGGRRTKALGYIADDINWSKLNGGAVGTPYLNQGTNPYGVIGGVRHDSDSESGSESDEEYELEGGKIKNPFKSVSKAFNKVGSDLGKAFTPVGNALSTGAEYANPIMWALKDKGTSEAMAKSGEITHDYLLPAVVSAGKPIYDATAMTASTMLTGNPVLGKVAADTLWNKMVAEPGYDPRENQKSKELGELSSTFGQAVSKPYSAALGGMGRNLVAEEFEMRDRQRRIGQRGRQRQSLEGAGIMDTLRSLYRYLNPPESFEAWRARRQHDRITQAEAEYLKEMARIEQQGLSAKQKRDQAIKSAKEYGVFEDIPMTDELRQVGENIKMGVEDIGSRLARQERKIEEEDPEWSLEGKGLRAVARKLHGKGVDFEKVKWGTFTRMFKEFKKEHPRSRVKDLEQFANYIIKNKKKFSDKALKKAHFYKNIIMKGGASTDQIGRASEMRTFAPRNTIPYNALSEIVHSADTMEANDHISLFFDLLHREDKKAEILLQGYEPSYLRALYTYINDSRSKLSRLGVNADELLGLVEGIWREKGLPEEELKIDTLSNTGWGKDNKAIEDIEDEIILVNPKARHAARSYPKQEAIKKKMAEEAAAEARRIAEAEKKRQDALDKRMKQIVLMKQGDAKDDAFVAFLEENKDYYGENLPSTQYKQFKSMERRLFETS